MAQKCSDFCVNWVINDQEVKTIGALRKFVSDIKGCIDQPRILADVFDLDDYYEAYIEDDDHLCVYSFG